MTRIDSTARIADGARIGANVEIGPSCVIGPDVSLGDGCRLISHVSIQGVTTVGQRAVIQPFASLGSPPQSVHYKGEKSRLLIGADCDIREGVTMNTGTAGGRMETRIGDRVMLMTGAHVGHDCIVGNDVILANNGTLGGHVEVGDYVFLGGIAAVHQNTRVGEYAIVGGLNAVRHDVIPFGAVGEDGTLSGLNWIGLKRRGFPRETIQTLRQAYRAMFFGAGSFGERVDATAAAYAGNEIVQRIVTFIREAGKRRLTMPSSADNEA